MEGSAGPGSTVAPSTTTTTKSMSVFVWSPSESGQSHVPGHIKIAFGFIAGAFLFIIIAFSTPYWLETDYELIDPKFLKIGTYFFL